MDCAKLDTKAKEDTDTATTQETRSLTAALLRTPKAYWHGAQRAVSPQETLTRVMGPARALGMTRVANVTGLDYLGIPVFMAIRPNARSLSVSQGKGLEPESAAASALMETLELAHAEEPTLRRVSASYAALKRRARVVDPRLFPSAGERPSLDQEMRWVEGVNLTDGSSLFVPFDLVDCRFDDRRRSPFVRSSNGLASGNVWLEAVCAGICEVIERDATSLWLHRTAAERRKRRVDPSSIRDRDWRNLISTLEQRGVTVALWDVTTDVEVASVICRIKEAVGHAPHTSRPFWGAGCHLAREVALIRAVTEAAQARLTYIAGSRDDLYCRNYEPADAPSVLQMVSDHWEQQQAPRLFESIPSNAGHTFEEDLTQLLARLKSTGLSQVIAVDLTNEQFGIPVVRIIVPGLEVHDELNRLKPGPRARALARERQ